MAINKIGVLGAGLMGAGIAQVAAASGYDVTLLEIDQQLIDRGLSGIERSLAKFVEKSAITAQQKTDTMRRLRGTVNQEELSDADLVIEAIVENLQVKREMFARLDQLCKAGTIFAS